MARASIAELITYAEMIKMSLDYACRHFEKTASGMVFPNTLAINAAKYYYAANYHHTVQLPARSRRRPGADATA